MRRAGSLKGAFTWSGGQEKHQLLKAEWSFYSYAAEGIRSGITVAIRTAKGSLAMVTPASDKPAIDLKREVDPIAAGAAVAQLNARVAIIDPNPSVEDGLVPDPKAALSQLDRPW